MENYIKKCPLCGVVSVIEVVDDNICRCLSCNMEFSTEKEKVSLPKDDRLWLCDNDIILQLPEGAAIEKATKEPMYKLINKSVKRFVNKELLLSLGYARKNGDATSDVKSPVCSNNGSTERTIVQPVNPEEEGLRLEFLNVEEDLWPCDKDFHFQLPKGVVLKKSKKEPMYKLITDGITKTVGIDWLLSVGYACKKRTDEMEKSIKKSDVVYFGSYPKDLVHDEQTISALNKLVNTLPTAENSGEWTGYGYFKKTYSSDKQNYMWFVDREYDGKKYRGVYLSSYRDNTYDDYIYLSLLSIHWFCFEPIKWMVMQIESGYLILLPLFILDSQEYQNEIEEKDGEYYNVSEGTPEGIYANNYEYSSIRRWINTTFCETAFTPYEQSLIQSVSVDNSASSLEEKDNRYVCNDTLDKIWILGELESFYYGFHARRTKYAASQGLNSCDFDYDGPSFYCLRSPEKTSNRCMTWDGEIRQEIEVDKACIGVVPAIKIKQENFEPDSNFCNWILKTPKKGL